MSDPHEPLDPDLVGERLESMAHHRGHAGDALWDKVVDPGPFEPQAILENREDQKMYLSRHGRIPFHTWEDREVAELRSAHAALVRLMRAEKGLPDAD